MSDPFGTEYEGKAFADALPLMEDGANIPHLSSPSECALVSLAISMKRIANTLNGRDATSATINDILWCISERMPSS